MGARARRCYTTPLGATGILAGTTQQLLFERAAQQGWQTADLLATVADLHAADALWLISSVRGPVEVIDLDGTPAAAPSGPPRRDHGALRLLIENRCRVYHSRRTVAVHERGGGPKLYSYWTREVAVR